MDAFDYRWPELANALRGDQTTTIALEDIARKPQLAESGGPLREHIRQLWEAHRGDSDLLEFLRLRPFFRNLFPREFSDFFAIAQTVAKAPTVEELIRVAQPTSDSTMPAAEVTPVAAAPLTYATVQIGIRPIVPSQSATTVPPSGHAQFQITLVSPDQDKISEIHTVDWAGLCEFIADHLPFPRDRESRRFATAITPALHAAATLGEAELPNPDPLLQEIGTWMYEKMLTAEVQRVLFDLLKDPNPVRIIFDFPERTSHAGIGVADLPWEALYVPAARVTPALFRKYSLVRLHGEPLQMPRLALTPPVPILAMLSSPSRVRRTNFAQHRTILEQSFEPLIRTGLVNLEVISPEHATTETLSAMLRDFKPQIFHFFGHGDYPTEDHPQGALMFADSRGVRTPVYADGLRNIFANHPSVRFAVLLACDSGTARAGDITTTSGE